MKRSIELKISISRFIPTVSIIAGIIYASLLTTSQTAFANQVPAGAFVTSQSPDTIGYKNIETHYYKGVKYAYLRIEKLTAGQIIAAISKYHRIPVEYRSKKLAKQDRCFDGTITLDANIKSIITILNRLGIYVRYDGKKFIAGE